MPHNPLPTSSAEALRNFVAGREQLQSYLASGSGHVLQEAKLSFSAATTYDPGFQLALFYRSLVETELREADAAIDGFGELLKEPTEFRTEILLHLAYAHIKRYQDDDFFTAKQLLADAREEARQGGRNDLQLFADALKVFLYSVMGGRLSDKSLRPGYLDQSIELGERLLQNELGIVGQTQQNEARFEVLNGLGVSNMRKGELAADPATQETYWNESEARFKEALVLLPTSVRAMQNMGTLKGIQAFQARRKACVSDAKSLFKQAEDWYARSLKLNPNDQFPHYRLAQLRALAGDWAGAQQFYDSGRQQSGAVKEKDWSKVKTAIENSDASQITW